MARLPVARGDKSTTSDGLGSKFGINPSIAESSLRIATRRGLLGKQILPVAVPELSVPIVTWSPSQTPPAFEAVAWAVRKRLEQAAPKRVVVLWATDLATRRVGGVGGRLRKPLQVEHDLGVAAFYFARCQYAPASPEHWIGEDLYARLRPMVRNQKRPDAALVDREGHVVAALDYLSLYPPARLRSFHHYWAARNTRYEWW